ncbi:MAG: hypothetical protein HYV09_28340 [Deltaproteobacteria bacterium]|nr:hypothetical protein [Deltaproteobacteria bacterium]
MEVGRRRVVEDAKSFALRFAPLVAGAGVLAWWCASSVRGKTGGEPSLPLDDAFIHFQYARALASGHPLVYVPGDPPTSGATSLLWSAVLAPFWRLGLRELRLVWIAWALSFVALALLALETRRLAARLLPRGSAVLAGALALLFGGHVWGAASGMEVVPFAWLLVRTARACAELFERVHEGAEGGAPLAPIPWRSPWEALARDEVDAATTASTRRLSIEVAISGALLPLLRPEGVVVALFSAVVLAATMRGRARALAAAPVAFALLPSLIFRAATGRAMATTAQVKWLLASPYVDLRAFLSRTIDNVHLLFGQLLDGKGPAKLFIPEHFAPLFLLGVVALAFAVRRRGHAFRAACVAVVAIGILVPTTYESFLTNRLRYLWPFTAAWGIALVAIGDLAATVASRFDPKLQALRAILGGLIVAVLAGELPDVVDDVAASAAGIHAQQIALARQVEATLPEGALVAVNDAGAIGYLSERRTFDVVGLTTPDEARHWVAGTGSRFEHYERLARAGKPLPTHLVVYPEWFEIAPVLGKKLFERTVEGASVLGAPTMVAHEAAWSPWLGSAELPLDAALSSRPLVDALDVADLESEAEHGFELLGATRADDGLVMNDKRIDGARLARTRDRFGLRVTPGGRLVMRVGTTQPLAFAKLLVDGVEVRRLELAGDPWQEQSFDVPATVAEGVHRIEVEAAPGQRFVSLHYWAFR